MDILLEKKINDTLEYINQLVDEPVDYQSMDPIAKMMLISVLHECQKIRDYVDGIGDKMIDRLCETFIPYDKVAAIPAIALVEPRFRAQKDSEPLVFEEGIVFSYKNGPGKLPINYIPVIRNQLLPFDEIYLLTPNKMYAGGASYDITLGKKNCLWVGIGSKAGVECLKGLSILIRGVRGISPSGLRVGTEERKVNFSDMSRLEDMEMLEPFDAQQSSAKLFSLVEKWKDILLNLEDGTLICVTEDTVDRDMYKSCTYPRVFQHWLESEMLDCFKSGTLWLQFEFPEGYVVPNTCSVVVNAVPVVNIDVNTLTLTQSSPIAKLQKQDGSYFIQIQETSSSANKQGFGMSTDEIIVRDFDAACYHNGDLYREVRTLYNHFIDDYYAFIEYNGIKDGETIRILRETINKIGKSVGLQNQKYKFDSGTYVMKNMNQDPPTLSTRVSYLTTLGRGGNIPRADEFMENKKLPSIEKDVRVVLSAAGGTDKASVDERYELLRYYTLTLDRLYTKKDIEAFLRKELIAEFGKDEFRRIVVRMSIEGAAGERCLQRGLYVDIEFRDKKNYDQAIDTAFDARMYRKIRNLSCISMPIIVSLKNLEE